MRRVRCDKTEPECFKCQKKGIKCSGQGIECRFSKHMKRKQAANSASTILAGGTGASTSSKPTKRFQFVNVENGQDGTFSTTPAQETAASYPEPLSSTSLVLASRRRGPELIRDRQGKPPQSQRGVVSFSSPHAAMEIVPPKSRMLFDHCN